MLGAAYHAARLRHQPVLNRVGRTPSPLRLASAPGSRRGHLLGARPGSISAGGSAPPPLPDRRPTSTFSSGITSEEAATAPSNSPQSNSPGEREGVRETGNRSDAAGRLFG